MIVLAIIACVLVILAGLYMVFEPEIITLQDEDGIKYIYFMYFTKIEDEWVCKKKLILKSKKNGKRGRKIQ